VSPPKLGKSWVLLQVGTAVATGVVALVPDDNPLHGDVLYLALEDNPRRLERRLTKYFGRDRRTWPSRLIIVTEWKRLDQGGLEAKNEMRSRSQQLQPSSIKGNPAAACGLTGGASLQTVSRLAGIHSTPASRPGVITDSRAHRELRQR
jgi:hypothetical protein